MRVHSCVIRQWNTRILRNYYTLYCYVELGQLCSDFRSRFFGIVLNNEFNIQVIYTFAELCVPGRK